MADPAARLPAAVEDVTKIKAANLSWERALAHFRKHLAA